MDPEASVDGGDACGYSGVPPAFSVPDRSPQQRQQSYRGWRRVIINFTPSWFSVNMGTGIASILLHNLPYNATWLYWVSVAIFSLNVAIFLLFLALSLMRYIIFPGLWTAMIGHPVQSLFLGAYICGLCRDAPGC